MNSFQAMHFVDKASPQQLKAMVDTQSPYSFMALAKLQQIRDAAMRQRAHEPTPPPLSQQIPQELSQAEAPAVPQTPVGIAALARNVAPQPQAGVGPEMATAAASGGLVAFREGGMPGFNGASDYAPSFLTDYLNQFRGKRVNPETGESYTSSGTSTDPRTLQYPSLLDRLLNPNAMNTYNDMYSRRRGQTTRADLAAQNAGQDVAPASALVSVPSTISETGDRYTPMSLAAEPTEADIAATTGIRNPNLRPGAGGEGASNAQAGAGGTQTGGGMYGRIMGMLPTKKDLDAVSEAQKEHIAELDRIQKGLAFDRKAYETAQGDVAGDRSKLLKSYQELFPDPNKDMKAALEGLKAENVKDIENAPYQGLLKMAVALMGTDRTNLFQAVGKAGGVGLEEMNRATEAAKQQKMKLLEADARVAAAQDARRRGDYDMATREAMQAKNDRMEVFRLEADSRSAQANAAAQLAAAKAGLPMERVKLQGQMVGTLAAIHQAFKDPAAPEAVRTWQFAQKNPAFLQHLQTQQDIQNASREYAIIEKNYDDELKAGAITDPKMTKNQYIEERMKLYLDFQQKQRTPRGTMPAQ